MILKAKRLFEKMNVGKTFVMQNELFALQNSSQWQNTNFQSEPFDFFRPPVFLSKPIDAVHFVKKIYQMAVL